MAQEFILDVERVTGACTVNMNDPLTRDTHHV